mgnify:CR=1 FL=1
MDKIKCQLPDARLASIAKGCSCKVWTRGYGYGASTGAWITDYFAGWAGEWGMVTHSNCSYRSPALTGDITIMTGSITGKTVDEQGRHLVQVTCRMENQTGAVLATAKAEIMLPRKPV